MMIASRKLARFLPSNVAITTSCSQDVLVNHNVHHGFRTTFVNEFSCTRLHQLTCNVRLKDQGRRRLCHKKILAATTNEPPVGARCFSVSPSVHIHSRSQHRRGNRLNNESGLFQHEKGLVITLCRSYVKSLSMDEVTPVTVSDIKKFFLGNKINFEQGHTCLITSCPKFTKHKLKLPELDRLYINKTTGYFVCHSCGHSGHWGLLRENIESIMSGSKPARGQGSQCFCDLEDIDVEECNEERQEATDLYDAAKPFDDQDPESRQRVKEKFEIKNIGDKFLEKFQVRYTKDSLLFPILHPNKSVDVVKVLTSSTAETPGDKPVMVEKTLPRHNPHGLFGWNTITKAVVTVVLTVRELDTIAINEHTKVMSLTLPRGMTTLPQEVLPMLEQFKKIILWFGNDVRSWEAMKQFSQKLGGQRCFLVSPSEHQPNATVALNNGQDLTKIIKRAKPYGHTSITSFRELRQEVQNELAHVEQVTGVKWKRYPQLNNLLKGHRTGELTVFTGPTGSGKTTFISDYSLDLSMEGVNTLWGSFEINNIRLMKMMLQQFAGKNLAKHLNEYDHYADRFETLPMYFMTFHGQESLKKVIETMSHAVYVNDITHVIVDNLQFMMGIDSDRMFADRFLRQDMIISSFRKFATNMNCHVTLVIHPRKERESEDLTTSSIFGSAKASQEADNILILQDNRMKSSRGKKYIQVTKNRFDGELGMMVLNFNKESLSFATKPKPKQQKPAAKSAEGTADLVVPSVAVDHNLEGDIEYTKESVETITETEWWRR